MSKKSKITIPFWLQLVAILLVGVVVSCSVFYFVRDYKAERYTVTFAYGNGAQIETKEVKEGKGIFPPELDWGADYVFRGWDRALNRVAANIEAHPDIYKVMEENLFYFDSVYVREGHAFTLDLMLGGNVNLSSGEVVLIFDEEVMEYKSFQTSEALDVTKTGKGELLIKLNSKNPITQKTELARLKFRAKRKDVEYTQAVLSAKSTKLILDGEEKPADCATINNKIFFIQEVG